MLLTEKLNSVTGKGVLKAKFHGRFADRARELRLDGGLKYRGSSHDGHRNITEAERSTTDERRP